MLFLLSLSLMAPEAADQGPVVALAESDLNTALPLDEPTLKALRRRKHTASVSGLKKLDPTTLPGNQVGDHAFLLAWSLLRAKRGGEAVDLVDQVRNAEHVPPAYAQLTVGEILLQDGDALGAATALEAVSQDSILWPRAQLVLADAYRKLERTVDARAVYESLAARPDPSEGSAQALEALVHMTGPGSDTSYPYDRRLWAAYPRTSEGLRASGRLKSYGPFATWQEGAVRADAMMNAYQYDAAISLGTKHASQVDETDPASCMLRYAHGRSLFKKGSVTAAAGILVPNGEACSGLDEDRGAKSLYLAGKSYERKKMWGTAAKHFERIAELYPEHSMADDGLVLAGIGYWESNQPDKARAAWEKQVVTYPTGDMAGEGAWRLAWTTWNEGDTEGAIGWADYSIENIPLHTSPEHVRAAMYWSARWKAFPNPQEPAYLDTVGLDAAIDGWEALTRDHPHSYYAILAAARLYEHAPSRLPERTERSSGTGWQVREAWADDPSASAGLQLARLGLYREALMEFQAAGYDNMTPAERALVTEQRWRAGDWLLAHDEMRSWLRSHPPEDLGVQRDDVLRVAYPETYWTEVQTATKGYSWDGRIFHALVREESNFNKDIRSHADAWGLSQLLPSTAKQVAGWMGTTVTTSQLTDPATNLKLGARYFESLMTTNGENPQLAMACYNAGCGNVKKWRTRFGDIPTDQFVESIPFRETRHYAKRVSRSWQVYHLLYDGGSTFPDLSAFNENAFAKAR